jgi:hypothetical protein
MMGLRNGKLVGQDDSTSKETAPTPALQSGNQQQQVKSESVTMEQFYAITQAMQTQQQNMETVLSQVQLLQEKLVSRQPETGYNPFTPPEQQQQQQWQQQPWSPISTNSYMTASGSQYIDAAKTSLFFSNIKTVNAYMKEHNFVEKSDFFEYFDTLRRTMHTHNMWNWEQNRLVQEVTEHTIMISLKGPAYAAAKRYSNTQMAAGSKPCANRLLVHLQEWAVGASFANKTTVFSNYNTIQYDKKRIMEFQQAMDHQAKLLYAAFGNRQIHPLELHAFIVMSKVGSDYEMQRKTMEAELAKGKYETACAEFLESIAEDFSRYHVKATPSAKVSVPTIAGAAEQGIQIAEKCFKHEGFGKDGRAKARNEEGKWICTACEPCKPCLNAGSSPKAAEHKTRSFKCQANLEKLSGKTNQLPHPLTSNATDRPTTTTTTQAAVGSRATTLAEEVSQYMAALQVDSKVNTEFNYPSASKAAMATPRPTNPTDATKGRHITGLMDSGCSFTMVNDRSLIQSLDIIPVHSVVSIANGETIDVEATGTIAVAVGQKVARMRGSIYSPSTAENLISVSALADANQISIFTKENHYLLEANDQNLNKPIGQLLSNTNPTGKRVGGVYRSTLPIAGPQANMARKKTRSLFEWHLAFNHLGFDALPGH